MPFRRPVQGTVRVPGSKSLTNRALILAALCPSPVELTGALFSRDTRIMVRALQQLGIPVAVDEGRQVIAVRGQGGAIPAAEATLDVGNAGTAARFLTAFLALREGGRYVLDGDPAMRERPMEGLLEALAAQGARFSFRGKAGHFPFVMETRGLPGGPILVDAGASSQLLSALLMVAPYAKTPATVGLAGATVSEPFVRLTIDLLAQFGVVASEESRGSYRFDGRQRPQAPAAAFPIEPDATAASYFAALPVVVGGRTLLSGVRRDLLQGDVGFLDVMASVGLEVRSEADGVSCSSGPGVGRGVTADFNAISDTFLTLAAIAPLLAGPTRITGIAHTRRQETDRVAAMATELRKLGQEVAETEDSLHIEPNAEALRGIAAEGARIHTYEDHRVAMSFGILGCADVRGDGQAWLTIEDPACTSKTYPHFFDDLRALHEASHR